jgi:uncharacterized protein (DUF2252 family)
VGVERELEALMSDDTAVIDPSAGPAPATGVSEPVKVTAQAASLEDRAATGRAVRRRLRRAQLGAWSPEPGRDPLAVLSAQEVTRVPELVPVRHERMAASPFAFYRGAAAVFANDLADQDHTGLIVQLCGDAHLVNFGAFASPERSLVFDLNDFDETLPGPFEWDVKRLAASFEVASRSNGFEQVDREAVQLALCTAYASSMVELAGMHHLDVWYQRLTVEEIIERWGAAAGPIAVDRFRRNLSKARSKDRLKAFRRLTTVDGGEPRFLSDPPLLEPARELMGERDHDELRALLSKALRSYRSTLSPDRRFLLDRYRFVDLARKVVGVGSVGTRCWVALLMGRDEGDPLFIQIKEAEASVLERSLPRSAYHHQGRRVVEGQRLMQAVSDIFLGWDQIEGIDGRVHDYYFRQLWDWKASADVDSMDPQVMGVYAQICGSILARAHARSGDSVAISAYVGGGDALGRAMIAFSSVYADQNEADHAALLQRWDAEAIAGA